MYSISIDDGRGDPLGTKGGDWAKNLREFLYGLAGYEFAQQALEIRRSTEKLFMLALFGELIGVPVLPPYYGLRLLPFAFPGIEAWKRSVLRERDLSDEHGLHLHGI
jgi:hypothetical protein